MTIEITVEIIGQLSIAFGHRGPGKLVLKETVPTGSTLLDLLDSLSGRYPEFAAQALHGGSRRLSGMVGVVLDGTMLTSETELRDKMKEHTLVVLVPQMAGG